MENIRVNIEQKKYGHDVVLQQIHRAYSTQQIHGILGANGAGKTTLFCCMSGVTDFEGTPTFHRNVKVGLLPAELFMYPKLKGEEFIHFCLKAKNVPANTNEIKILSDQFELPLQQYAEQYSTGMLKKLYLMALILQKNDVLLLDEPFNGLDYLSVALITEWIKQLKEQGATFFISSHNMEHLVSFCDTLSILQNKSITFYSNSSDFKEITQILTQKAKEKVKEFFGGDL